MIHFKPYGGGTVRYCPTEGPTTHHTDKVTCPYCLEALREQGRYEEAHDL